MKPNRVKPHIVFFIILAVFFSVLSSCGKNKNNKTETEGSEKISDTEKQIEYNEPENGFCGIDFGISSAYGRKLDIDRITELLQIMNAGAVRNEINMTTVLSDSTTANKKQIELQKEWINKLYDHGITKIIAVSNGWLHTEKSEINDRYAVPAWNNSEDSEFKEWLTLYEESWKTMASMFPEIHFWEIGSALNTDAYLHPVDYLNSGNVFNLDEKLEIITEMCFAASRGIHSSNPEAIVIFPGILIDDNFDDARKIIKKIYRNIGSGQYGCGSTDPDDYFGAIALQYHSPATDFDIDEWINACKRFSDLIAEYGDSDKKLFITEFGFSDSDSQASDQTQGKLLEQALEAMENCNYIDSVYVYKMIEGSSDVPDTERCYGLFSVDGKSGFIPKEKANAVCSFFGGKTDQLNKYEKPIESEGPNVNIESKTLSYLCTWGRQSYAASKMGISGSGSSEMRDALTAESLFGTVNYYHIIPKEYRSNLIFLIDDGWDVPLGTSGDGSRSEFGSLEPDPIKFASLGDTAQERLNEMSKKTKELGYAGLGLWVSPQIPGEGWTNAEEARSYWEERARMSAEAGILYWKVDWGKHQTDTEYRKMITEVCAKYAPNLTVEHAYTQVPFTESNPDRNFKEEREKAVSLLTSIGGVFRIYDLSAPFETVCALGRTDQALRAARGSGVNSYINVESEGYIGAVLGLPVGIMSYDTEMQVYLKWQQESPIFGTEQAEYYCSENMLTDTYYFEKELFPGWFECANKLLSETAPAIMSRGCSLPRVSTGSNGITPFIAASKNPLTGTFSIGAFSRTIDPNTGINGNVNVSAEVGASDTKIGIFGVFGKLTLTFDEDISGYSIYGKDILSDKLRDITGLVSISSNTLTIDGTVIRTVGKEARKTNDSSLPAMMIVLKPAE